MFSHEGSACQSRVLIASADTEARRHIGEIVRLADLRAVGFIRETEQVESRTLLSVPDVLLMDLETFRRFDLPHTRLAKPQSEGSLKVMVWAHNLSPHALLDCKRNGVENVLDLARFAANDTNGPAGWLRKLLVTEGTKIAPPLAIVPQPAAVCASRKTLAPASVVIGSSTGGPMALMTLLKGLPADFPLPIAVVQHMPPGFTQMLAERLHAECALRVVEGEAGMDFVPGTVYLAPGGMHMVLCGASKAPRIDLNALQPENSCRPAVDVLFRSSAAVYNGRQHAIVLTGMGRDGLAGAMHLRSLGSRIVVQDAATSTVWGMPGSIAQAGLADDILPIDQIAPHLLRCL